MSQVVVTGGSGFIGQFLLRELIALGHQVTVVDVKDPKARMTPAQQQTFDEARGRWVPLDLEQESSVGCLVDVLRPVDYLIAGAAHVGGIRYFHRNEYTLLAANERITANTYDAAIQVRGTLKKVVLISSSMVYESCKEGTLLREDMPFLPPRSSYGFQKLMAEKFAESALSQYGLQTTIVRPFNCIGEGELPHVTNSHVVPDLVLKIRDRWDGEKYTAPIPLIGNGEQMRCFTYGSDIARGIRLAMDHVPVGVEAFNVASECPVTIRFLADAIGRAMGLPLPEYAEGEFLPFDVQTRLPSTHKAKTILGFAHEVGLGQALDRIVPWVLENVKGSQ